jgi:hypothetical protein
MDLDSSLTEKQQLFYDFIAGVKNRTMEGVLEQFGPPSRYCGPFQFALPNECGNAVFHYACSIEFDGVGPMGYTFVVCERSSGALDLSFRPPFPGGQTPSAE